MATLTTVYGANATLRDQTVPPVALASQQNYGRVRVLQDSYTQSASDEFGTSGIINMMKIPKGARVVDGILAITTSGSAGKFEVGWAAGATGTEVADANGLYEEVDPGNAALTGQRMSSVVAGFNKTFAEEVQVQLDCTEATAGGAAAVYELTLFIVVD